MAEVGESSLLVGKASLNISEVLMFPQNKIQLDTKVVSADGECSSHMNSIKACSCQGTSTRRRHLGNLSLWFRLTCEMDVLKAHAEHFWTEGNGGRGRDSARKSPRRALTIKKTERSIFESDKDSSSEACDDFDGGISDGEELTADSVKAGGGVHRKYRDMKVIKEVCFCRY